MVGIEYFWSYVSIGIIGYIVIGLYWMPFRHNKAEWQLTSKELFITIFLWWWEMVYVFSSCDNKEKENIWKMPFVVSEAFSVNSLPVILRKHFVMLSSDRVTNGPLEPHLLGVGHPPEEILEAITGHFDQYLEMSMSNGEDSYVWPSYQKDYIRCPGEKAIDHFNRHL